MEKTKDNKLILKIVVPIIIVIMIVGVWFISNMEDEGTVAVATDNEDFALISETLDLDELKSYGLPILIDFGADECVPCKEMEPVLVELNEEYQGKVIVKFYDVWKDPTFAANFPVQVVPTQFFFDAEGNPYMPSETDELGLIMYQTSDTKEHVYTAHEGGMTKEQLELVFEDLGVEK